MWILVLLALPVSFQVLASDPEVVFIDRSTEEQIAYELRTLDGDVAIIEKGLPSVSDAWAAQSVQVSESTQ